VDRATYHRAVGNEQIFEIVCVVVFFFVIFVNYQVFVDTRYVHCK
jgi:hypothetical protein